VGTHTSITIDGMGNVHISYYDAVNGDLKYATNAYGGVWGADVVDTVGYVGMYSSIKAEKTAGQVGKVHMSYYDVMNLSLKYAETQ
jgi:hypothetical protein